jgi:hypothetical protein
MSEHLFVFSLSATGEVRHTHLTRSMGEAPDLPPLTDWLGAEVDEAAIELFPVKDLGDMSLSEYVRLAFAPETIPAQDARRMDALKGTVLLVPEHALSEEPAPGKQAKLIATLPLARADHSGELPKAEVAPLPRPEPPPSTASATERRGSKLWLAFGVVLVLAALAWLLVL